MKASIGLTRKIVSQPSVLSNYEKAFISTTENIATLASPEYIHKLRPKEQEVLYCYGIIKEALAPGTELITQLDTVASTWKNNKFKKSSVISALKLHGINIEEHTTILGKENNCSFTFIGEAIMLARLHKEMPSIQKKILRDENSAPSLYNYQTRQKNLDLEYSFEYKNLSITRGADIKIGNIKFENVSNILPIVYDEKNELLTGILNNRITTNNFLLGKVSFLSRIQKHIKSDTARTLVNNNLSILQNQDLNFDQKIAQSNILSLELTGCLASEKNNGIYNPSFYTISYGSFEDTGHRTFLRHEEGLDTMKHRKIMGRDFLVSNNKEGILEILGAFKGTAFESLLSDISDITLNI